MSLNAMISFLGVITSKSVLETGNLWPDLNGVVFLAQESSIWADLSRKVSSLFQDDWEHACNCFQLGALLELESPRWCFLFLQGFCDLLSLNVLIHASPMEAGSLDGVFKEGVKKG